MVLIAATPLLGKPKLIPEVVLLPRRSAYGVVPDGDRLLLVNTRSTGTWLFPGGRCDPDETDAEAVMREIREETGISVEVGSRLAETENVWYDDTTGDVYRQRGLFFRCRPLTTVFSSAFNPDPDDQAESPTWVPLNRFTPEDFQGFWNERFPFL